MKYGFCALWVSANSYCFSSECVPGERCGTMRPLFFLQGLAVTDSAQIPLPDHLAVDPRSPHHVAAVFQQAYAEKPLVRLYDKGVPALKNVVGLPFCDIGFAVQDEHIIVVAAEDNLLKGAAAQAVQCANIRFGFAETQSLI